jgi:hypothetical protein
VRKIAGAASKLRSQVSHKLTHIFVYSLDFLRLVDLEDWSTTLSDGVHQVLDLSLSKMS